MIVGLLTAIGPVCAQMANSKAKLPIPQIAGEWSGGMYDNIIPASGILDITIVQNKKGAIGGVWQADLLDSGSLSGSIKATQVFGLPQGKVSVTLKIRDTNSGVRHPCAITAVGVVELDSDGSPIDISGTYRSCKHESGSFFLLSGPGNGQFC
jgi:hypothetical protein